MRTIIAGSRTCTNQEWLDAALVMCGWVPTTVISGGASGADKLGELWAKCATVPCERFLADWTRYGRSAGYRRNVVMSENAEALIALWDGESNGTKHMIDIAKRKGLRVYVHLIGDYDDILY